MKILNIIILICGVICTFLGILFVCREDQNKEKIINFLLVLLGLAVSALSVENIYYYNIINVLNEQVYNLETNFNIENSNKTTITENNNIENTINSNNQITNNTVFESAYDDENTLMNYAIFYYTANNLESVARIYGNSKLINNPIALTNLGYMYANGIYFTQNFEMAEIYYNKAISLGYEQAMCNKLAMYINNGLPDIISVLIEGFENRNEKIAKFVSSNYYRDEPEINMAMYYDFCLLNEEEQLTEIDSWYYWDEGIVETHWEKPYPTYVQKFEFVRFQDIGNSVAMIFKKYEKHCYNVEILDEKFILDTNDIK